MKNAIKLRIFIGLVAVVFLLALFMVVLLALGADNAGDIVKWTSVGVSIFFMAIASWLSRK